MLLSDRDRAGAFGTPFTTGFRTIQGTTFELVRPHRDRAFETLSAT